MDRRIAKRTAILLLLDIGATYLAYWLASLLTDVVEEVFINNEIYFVLGILAFINVVGLALMRMYTNLWEYAGVDEAIQICLSVILSTLAGAVFLWIIEVRLPIRVYFVATFLLIFLVGGTRLVFRLVRQKGYAFRRDDATLVRPRTLVVGAGETGSLAIARMASRDPLMPGLPVVATDDNPSKRGSRIHGVKVAGTTEDIVDLVDRYDVEQIVVAIPSSTPDERKRIYAECTKTECKLRTLPNVRELSLDEIGDVSLRDVDVADLLGREEILLNTRAVSGYIAGETILVTGGGGSIGSELCRQLCCVAPTRIVIFDIYENDAYMLRNELLSRYDDIDVVIEIGSICDEDRIQEVFEKYRPSAVFHAAAHKHVPLMEACPREALRNNVFGTLNTVRAANAFGVDRFIFISTDKAVNPTSVMGATKRMGEMIVQFYARTSKTIFTAVRFGNVLGSNGSVIPLFQRQIAAGGPVTVTHPDIERFFMTIPEASRLVIQAGGMAKGGEIFILDMGEPVKIVDLARGLIHLQGLTPDVDVAITFTGLREGEKMYEELLMDEEATLPTNNSSIMISTGQEISYEVVAAKIEDLHQALDATDEEAIAILEQAVPTYRHTPNK
ncbi:polysaccharide biosynthesis protein [Xiamenia xianingshaonis]|uniref:NAD-dependent epimerase/dehydratase family protein n=1 Tax=Xiamenia xianingshaonis TaxID=2682776 RepID=A0A9E6SUI8_9ACTN|nr:nucleoside-diphosphate sugar epimerase/dehydratase [Xiamenia xianingshaonis]NHM13390.1 NAD-dependent epimerase/dehydratase family protein [Xiamenia xianingshaonis]QTU84531.1 polysaccharide biosynthesis protein [Xiamenia xianingshaonis]